MGDQALASFAEYFSQPAFGDSTKMLNGESRPMTTVGNFDMMQFPIKAPTRVIKVNTDTNVRAECSFSASTAGTCTVALCIAELAKDKWRLVKGSVSTPGQSKVVIEATLEARGNRYVVFVGTPTNKGETEPELNLEIAADQQIDVMDQ